jgi:repressor LexA
MDDFQKRILKGNRIRERRVNSGLSQTELGDKLGVKFTTISKYENGEIKSIDSDILSLIADITNTDIDYLLLKTDIPDKLDYKYSKDINTSDVYTDIVEIPILGKISAGTPIMAIQNIEGTHVYPKALLSPNHEYFFLRVKGDSMNLKFNDGDLVLVQKQDVLENGEIGVILVNGYDATVKRFKKQDNLIILEPMSTNNQHSAQIYDSTKINITVVGKVVRYLGNV